MRESEQTPVRRVEISLSAALKSGGLAAAIRLLLEGGFSVYCDIAVANETPPVDESHCKLVGSAGPSPGLLQKFLWAMGVRYAKYYTCEVESNTVLERFVTAALPMNEFRLRSFRPNKKAIDPYSWNVKEFWRAGTGTPEEAQADLVIAATDDGSSLIVRGTPPLIDSVAGHLCG